MERVTKKDLFRRFVRSLLIGILIVAGLIGVLWVVDSYSATVYDDIKHVEYLENYDGDTIKVNIVGYRDIIGLEIPIRVAGIDTPEIRGKCVNEKVEAIKAKRFVAKELMYAKRIKILQPMRDKYFRIVGEVWYDGKYLSSQLLSEGLAVPYDGGTKTNPWCE